MEPFELVLLLDDRLVHFRAELLSSFVVEGSLGDELIISQHEFSEVGSDFSQIQRDSGPRLVVEQSRTTERLQCVAELMKQFLDLVH